MSPVTRKTFSSIPHGRGGGGEGEGGGRGWNGRERCSQNAVQEVAEGPPTREVEDDVHLPQAPVANEDNGRGILESSWHAIPKPSSAESLSR